ncbi:hypothetical protein [Halogeometricum limi]|uniref:hypothetical protein n=1 Tax=Halogeometricum limi TaxID=555875 RepID=UPI00111451D9|nr:hypothetical protein [Halogeometricum limi]
MKQLVRTWPGKAARDVFLGAVGGLVATSGGDGVFGISVPAGDLETLLVAIAFLPVLHLAESVAIDLFGLEEDDDW